MKKHVMLHIRCLRCPRHHYTAYRVRIGGLFLTSQLRFPFIVRPSFVNQHIPKLPLETLFFLPQHSNSSSAS